MDICLHVTYFLLSEMSHCYKTGIYFDWILKVLSTNVSKLTVRVINYSPQQ